MVLVLLEVRTKEKQLYLLIYLAALLVPMTFLIGKNRRLWLDNRAVNKQDRMVHFASLNMHALRKLLRDDSVIHGLVEQAKKRNVRSSCFYSERFLSLGSF